jgi:hypothetical protein
MKEWAGKPRVHAVVRVLDRNCSGLLTGFAALARQGRIRYTQKMEPAPAPHTSGPWHLRDKDDSNIEVYVDDRASGFIDFHDSWELNEAGFRDHDVYFKRSLDPAKHPAERLSRLQPLGLIYEVWSNGFDRWEAERILTQVVPARTRARNFAQYATKLAASWLGAGPRPNIALTSAPPDPAQPPRVLFMVGLWDPAQVARHDPSRAPEFEAINRTRAGCVRQLRAALPGAFYGGVQHSAFARREAADALLPDSAVSSKRRYLERVRQYPICVATTGLHGSNGCKLGEYVSLSRAILSEPLQYVVPGDFLPGRNYLPFETPDECVRGALQLFHDGALRAEMMRANHAYYDAWLRPDAMAAHVVSGILERR